MLKEKWEISGLDKLAVRDQLLGAPDLWTLNSGATSRKTPPSPALQSAPRPEVWASL